MASSAARPLGPLLPPSVLELSKALPLKPAPVTLRGRFVTLVPYEEAAHLDALYAVSCGAPALGHPAYDWDTDLWRYLLIPSLAGGATVAQCTGADGCLTRDAFTVAQRSRAGAADRRIFVVLLHEDGATSGFPRDGPWAITAADGSSPALVVGQIALMRNAPADLTIEIGVVCMSPAVHGTPVATEATYLLLRHAFAAGYRRVEWKANALNARSCAAALRMGFTHEGVFRQHMVVHDGVSRDTWWSAMLDCEWEPPVASADSAAVSAALPQTGAGAAAGASLPAAAEWSRRAALEAWLASDDPARLFARRATQLAALREAAAAKSTGGTL